LIGSTCLEQLCESMLVALQEMDMQSVVGRVHARLGDDSAGGGALDSREAGASGTECAGLLLVSHKRIEERWCRCSIQ
jgi:hypothetical protein